MLEESEARQRLASLFSGDSRVAAAWIFGSQARGEARPDSDWDVAILPAEDLDSAAAMSVEGVWRSRAAAALGLPETRMDIVVLGNEPALLAHRVLRDGELIADRLSARRCGWTVRAFQRAQDAIILRRLAMAARARRVAEPPSP
jgi:predicted nucleotidyltransferase